MTPESNHTRPNPYFLVALCSGGASAVIAIAALANFPRVEGAASVVWAVALMIAVMVAAPAVMGIGIAYFMSKQPPRD